MPSQISAGQLKPIAVFVRPEKTGGRKKRFARIFQVAKQAAVNHGHFPRNDKSLPALSILKPHLTADVLYCSGISPEQESHLDYFMLVSIQLWLMRRELRTISDEQLFLTSLELNKSIERGFAEKRLNAVLAVLPKRLRAVAIKAAEDIKRVFQRTGKTGGSTKNQKLYAKPKEYAERLFLEFIKRPSPMHRSQQVAGDIHEKLKETYPIVKKASPASEGQCPSESTILKKWIPEFKKKHRAKK